MLSTSINCKTPFIPTDSDGNFYNRRCQVTKIVSAVWFSNGQMKKPGPLWCAKRVYATVGSNFCWPAKSFHVGGCLVPSKSSEENKLELKACCAPAIADSAPAAQPTLTSAAIGGLNSDPLSVTSFLPSPAQRLQRWPFGIMLRLARKLLRCGAVAATARHDHCTEPAVGRRCKHWGKTYGDLSYLSRIPVADGCNWYFRKFDQSML